MTISELITRAAGQLSGRIAVAAAHDADVLRAVSMAYENNIVEPILIGNIGEMRRILQDMGVDDTEFEMIESSDDTDAAKKAVECAASGRADFLMKGMMNTADLMRAVLDRETGIRTDKLISHIMLYEPAGHKLMALTDGGMNPFPDLEKKISILENAAETLRLLGYSSINTACICGAETVNPKIPSMTDAAAIAGMREHWATYHMNVFGPVGLDLAVSPEACRHKGYEATGAGEADILLVPTYEVGNALGKALSLFGGAKNAGIIVGATVPIVLVSRSDNADTKLASIAFGACVACAQKK